MRLVTLFSAGSDIPAASLNAMQARGAGLTRASGAPSDGPTAQGADLLHYQTPDAGLATGTVATVDATSGYDWRERLVLTWARFASSAAGRWGRASEHAGNDAASSDLRTALGVTGPGATGTAAATVANGTPPVVGTDSCPIPIDTRAGGTLWLFADPSSGALKVYNATGATLHFDMLFVATGRAVDPSAPPPDIVPTMTEVLWLTPTVAASRPADPGATIALHRATDTGAVTLWDGGAWRALGTPSPTTTRGDMVRRGATADERFGLGPRGYALRAGATDPGWAALQVSDSTMPTAGSDYAGTIYYRTDLGGWWICTKGGLSNSYAWRLLSIGDGDVKGTTTKDDSWANVATTALVENAVSLLDVEIVGVKNDLSDALVARGDAGWANVGGTLFEIEALTLRIGDDTRVRLDPSGASLRVQVKGVVSEDWTWRVSLTRRLEVTP